MSQQDLDLLKQAFKEGFAAHWANPDLNLDQALQQFLKDLDSGNK